jgi:Xaa-Pro aminopeptidase
MGFSKRIGKLESLMNGYDGFLITDPSDIFYYTGYKPLDNGFLLVLRKKKPVLFLSPLENEAECVKTCDVLFFKRLKEIVKYTENKKIGFDEHNLSQYLYSKLKTKVKLRPASDIIKKPMLIKDKEEIEKIKKAVNITKNVLSGIDFLGKSEYEVSREIKTGFLKHDALEAFPTIVATGKNSYYIHHRPNKKIITKKDLVIVDLGAKFREYCADITRTFCFLPDIKRRKIIEDVEEIQSEIIDSIEVGMKFKELQKLYEMLMKKKGYETKHAIGHSLGLSVHEKIDVIENNMVIAIEPGIYIKNIGGCRKEDVFLVKNNKIRMLS